MLYLVLVVTYHQLLVLVRAIVLFGDKVDDKIDVYWSLVYCSKLCILKLRLTNSGVQIFR